MQLVRATSNTQLNIKQNDILSENGFCDLDLYSQVLAIPNDNLDHGRDSAYYITARYLQNDTYNFATV